MDIQMVDIQAQYKRLKIEIDTAVLQALEEAHFINGPQVQQFSEELKEYLGTSHVIPCANGTDALQVALMALDLQPGDEVITTNFTFISTVEVLVLLRLIPVLVDVDPVTFNIDPEAIKKAITPKTKAIIPVHLFGQPADMDPILEMANQHGLYVIEDNAQSLGAWYFHRDGRKSRTGNMGDIGTTSFFPTKPLGCYGDGGALVTGNEKLAVKLRMIINHGARIKYYHEIIGVNSRLDTLQAAILRVNLRHLDEFMEARQKAAAHYELRLGGRNDIITPALSSHGTHVYHQYTLVIRDHRRKEILERLAKAEIPAMIYYPVALSLQDAFRQAGYQKGQFPVTEDLCDSVLSLPIHTEMSLAQIDYICDHLIQLL